MKILKSIILIIGLLLFSELFVIFFEQINKYVELPVYRSNITFVVGLISVIGGIVIRLWASMTFYNRQLRIISFRAQNKLVQEGPYSCSRNPLYIGIFSIFFGVILLAGSTMSFLAGIIFFIGWDMCLHLYEEPNLEKKFGEQYIEYKKRVPRWIGIPKSKL